MNNNNQTSNINEIEKLKKEATTSLEKSQEALVSVLQALTLLEEQYQKLNKSVESALESYKSE